MKITKANGKDEYEIIESLRKRSVKEDENTTDVVKKIINNVKENGDEAVREYTARFDNVIPKKACIEKKEI